MPLRRPQEDSSYHIIFELNKVCDWDLNSRPCAPTTLSQQRGSINSVMFHEVNCWFVDIATTKHYFMSNSVDQSLSTLMKVQ